MFCIQFEKLKVRFRLKNISCEINLHCASSVSVKPLCKNDNFTLIWRIFREIDLLYILFLSPPEKCCMKKIHALYTMIYWQKKLFSRNFWEKMWHQQHNSMISLNCDLVHTVRKLRKFTHTLFWQKFRESNTFTMLYAKY